MNNPHITRTEAAILLNRSIKTIDRYIARGMLTSYRKDRKIYVDRTEIETLITQVDPANPATDVRFPSKPQNLKRIEIISPKPQNFNIAAGDSHRQSEETPKNTIANQQNFGFITRQLEKLETKLENITPELPTDLLDITTRKISNAHTLHIDFLQKSLTETQNSLETAKKRLEAAHFRVGELEEKTRSMVPALSLQHRELDLVQTEKDLITARFHITESETRLTRSIFFISAGFLIVFALFFTLQLTASSPTPKTEYLSYLHSIASPQFL